jgi:hypothetical protein
VPAEEGRAALEAVLGAPVVAFELMPAEPEPAADHAAERAAPAPAPVTAPEPPPEPAVTLPEDWLMPAVPPPPDDAVSGAAWTPPATPPPVAPTAPGVGQRGVGRVPWWH